MADAAGTWDATTLSTVASLAKFEKEITELVSVGSKTYSVQDGDVSDAIAPGSIDVSDLKGTIEVIGVAETQCVLSGLSIAITESDDDSTFTTYGTGLTIYSKTGTVAAGTELFRYVIPSDFEDYFKPSITIGTSTGTISIYANSIWDNKIEMAKAIIGTDLSLLLINNKLREYLEEDDDILDSVYNPTDLGLVSDFKTLELIYSDLARGADTPSLFWQKSKEYRRKYDEYFLKSVKMLTIDLYQDGTELIYYADLDFISEFKR
jgi:hypothetical protein